MASFKATIEVFLDGDCENEAREFVAETMRDVFRQICPFTSPMIGWRFCDQEEGSQPKTMPATEHDNPRSPWVAIGGSVSRKGSMNDYRRGWPSRVRKEGQLDGSSRAIFGRFALAGSSRTSELSLRPRSVDAQPTSESRTMCDHAGEIEVTRVSRSME